MSALLFAALVNEIAIPELTRWLISLHTAGTPVTDAVIIAKLASDTALGEQIGLAWLASHGGTPAPAV